MSTTALCASEARNSRECYSEVYVYSPLWQLQDLHLWSVCVETAGRNRHAGLPAPTRVIDVWAAGLLARHVRSRRRIGFRV